MYDCYKLCLDMDGEEPNREEQQEQQGLAQQQQQQQQQQMQQQQMQQQQMQQHQMLQQTPWHISNNEGTGEQSKSILRNLFLA